ncbi:DUF262 domain-containing protein [Mesoflavibacter zeaxanthinifaciens]|jgi:hypothetical protein|uniref:DUF262 domain-containing protein n=1 Tax=Mesoflavibacter zeaxanthinifaciens TaxID=393060 RepID=UPI003A90B2FD
MTDVQIQNLTFLELINDNDIVIPIIQRDYVQGRSSNEVSELRQGFLLKLFESINKDKPPLNLGFIYGKVLDKNLVQVRKKNKSAIEDILQSIKGYASHLDEEITFDVNWKKGNDFEGKNESTKFIPLDGQQRLTTLFLIHWYLFKSCGDSDLNKLKRFKYATRKSTKLFLQYLMTQKVDFSSEKGLKEGLPENTWFYNEWLYDPSVQSMLNTLEDIHLTLKNFNKKLLCQNIKERLVIFDYLDLDSIEQTDEIYVKMNARGKQISDFEHFKAWLLGYLKEEKLIDAITVKNWKDHIDVKWLDLFWEENDVQFTGLSMLDFFQNMALSKILASELIFEDKEEQEKQELEKERFYNLIKKNSLSERYLPIEDLKQLFTVENLNNIFSILNLLSDPLIEDFEIVIREVTGNRDYRLKKQLLDFKLFEKSSQNDQIFVNSIISYGTLLISSETKFDRKNFSSWVRIMRNLSQNTFIQGYKDYKSALRSIQEIEDKCFKIEDHILLGQSFSFFNNEQQKEEKLKLQKIQISDQWKNHIIEYENNNYFNGQIGFFFDILEDNEKEDVEKFKKIGDKLCLIFSKEIYSNYSVFQAALLNNVDYTMRKNSKWSLLDKGHNDLRTRFDNWRKVFKKDEESSPGNIPFNGLKKIVRDSRSLQEIKDDCLVTDWRYIFIKNKALIEYCGRNLFYFENAQDIQLISGASFSGKSVDAYLLFLFKYLKKNIVDIKIVIEEINNIKTSENYSKILYTAPSANFSIEVSYDPSPKITKFNFKHLLYNSTKDDKRIFEILSQELKTKNEFEFYLDVFADETEDENDEIFTKNYLIVIEKIKNLIINLNSNG